MFLSFFFFLIQDRFRDSMWKKNEDEGIKKNFSKTII